MLFIEVTSTYLINRTAFILVLINVKVSLCLKKYQIINILYRVSEKSLCTCWNYVTLNILTVTIRVGSGSHGLGRALQKLC